MRCPGCAHDNREGARFCEECGAALAGGQAESSHVAPAIPPAVGGGRFLLTRLLGEGARKRVYAATDGRLGREVAVALVKTDDLDEAGRQRIEREAAAMARLGDHPNIVTVFDVGEEDGGPYIVSQLMPGGSIADLLAAAPDHRLPVDEAIRIGLQLSLALAHAHGHGVVHRDLKPANAWRASDGSVLLGDFGLAAVADHSRLTAEGLVVGTVAYLAPEQAVGRPPDARSDLYSLGALLYELVSGRPPFLGDDAVTVISQHLNTAPVAPSWHNAEVPAPLDALVLRLLAKNPDDRLQSASAVHDELLRIAEIPAAAVATPAPPSRLLPMGRLVGRSGELTQLTSAFDAVVSGESRLVMVVGEPGIGKTRLMEELAVYAGVRGATVCWGHCYEGELGMPYLPFVEAFRSYVRERTDEELRLELSTGAPEVATLVSEVRQRLGDLPPSPPLEGDAERLRLFEGVATFLRNASVSRPLVLLLDDLHWADKPTLLMLQYLARNLRTDRVLLVGTYRDVELDRTHPLADAVASLRRERLYERVLLRGLSPEEVKALIDAVDNQDSPIAFAAAIHRETEGNPFFIAEILRNLVESGAIAKVDGRWVGSPEITENLPEGVREVIGRRLSRLSESCNRMLTVGAAMPGGFSLDVVTQVLGSDEEQVLDALDEALDHQVLRERRDAAGSYEFNHALIRQTLYGELSTPRRVRLHRQIAEALEKSGAGDADLAALAFHCFHGAPGGDVGKAVDYATRAGDRARGHAAHEEAARFYDMALQALDLVDGGDDSVRGNLYLALATAKQRAGDAEGSSAAFEQTIALARTLGDPVLLGKAAMTLTSLRYSSGGTTGFETDTLALLEEAIGGLRGIDDALVSRLLAAEARLYYLVDQSRVTALADEALALARSIGDPGATASALATVAFGRLEDTTDLSGEMARLAEEAGDLDMAALSQMLRMGVALYATDRAKLDAAVTEIARLATESRSPFHYANAAIGHACVAFLEGRYEDGERYANEVLGHGRRLRDRGMVVNYGLMIYPMYRERGMLGVLEEPTRRAADRSGLRSWRVGLIHILSETGKREEASAEMDAIAAAGWDDWPNDTARRYGLCTLAEIAAGLGHADSARGILPLLRPAADGAAALGPGTYHGAVNRYIGLAQLAIGDRDGACASLERALATETLMRARPWIARTQYDLARALIGRAGPGDRERAVRTLNDTLQMANEIGMPVLSEQALAVKLEIQGIASSSPQHSIDMVAAGVSVERPDLSHDTGVDGRVTIVFSDIEGYTATVERLGDDRSQVLLRDHDRLVRQAVASHNGRVVKSQGDGFMMAFTSPADALGCAVDVQLAIEGHDFGGEEVHLRIGVHAGSVIHEGDDFFGRTVILAARVADSASGGEILTTSEIREAVPHLRYGPGRAVALKGLTGTHTVYPVAWRAAP